jgi:DNA polymerase III delta subunit
VVSEPAVAFLHGDDEYGLDQAALSIAARLGSEGEAPVRWQAIGAEVDAAMIAERVATATLFGGGTLAVIVDPAPLARSSQGRAAIAEAIGAVAPGNGLVFIAPSGNARRPVAANEAIRTAVAEAGGEIVEVRSPRPDRFPGWIVERGRERGLDISADAARELAERLGAAVRDGDVDRSGMSRVAIGELDKLALYAGSRPVTAMDVQALVPESTPASVWGFLDAVAERRPRRIAETLGPILESTPEPVVVAALHRRIRDLIEVADRLAAGESVPSLVRTMRIKEYPARKLASQAARWRADELIAALEGLADIDALVKGEPPASETQRRLAFTLWIEERVVVR